jgi:hypothetical protein
MQMTSRESTQLKLRNVSAKALVNTGKTLQLAQQKLTQTKLLKML